jgi:hypothetical protein
VSAEGAPDLDRALDAIALAAPDIEWRAPGPAVVTCGQVH